VTAKKPRKPNADTSQQAACPSCGIGLMSDARFCHACGTALDGAPGSRLMWWGGAIVAVAAVTLIAMIVMERGNTPPAPTTPRGPAFTAPTSGTPPDLSQMSPREAADRLFNRVMMADERGDRTEALTFAPMAVEAYAGLGELDRDAQYHLALIHGVAGDTAGVERAIAAMREGAPGHLLALILEHQMALARGDRDAAARIRVAFDTHYPAEIALSRPEYQDHGNIIERFRIDVAAPAAATSGVLAGSEQAGRAAVYTARCAMCHGTGGTGTDKGPPLVHKIYEPSHHDDASFRRAVQQGVQAHHWNFGDMAPVPGVGAAETEQIIGYVRDLQRKAGIR